MSQAMRVFLFGATSEIVGQVAIRMAHRGARFYLAARDNGKLERMRDDLLVRGAKEVHISACDASDHDVHQSLVASAFQELGEIDVAIIGHGTLPDQSLCQKSVVEAMVAIDLNCLSFISLLSHLANEMEHRKHGTIVAITSVAGMRGRQSNYVYGSAKSAVSFFLEGLSLRLDDSNVRVIDVRPGLVDTPMTSELKKGLLWASPQKVGKDIDIAIAKRRRIVYTPWFWRYIMLVIRLLPYRLFARLKL